MSNRFIKCMNKKTEKTLLSITMVLIMVFSVVSDAFAATPPSEVYVTTISFDGGHTVGDYLLKLDVSKLTTDYQSVPVDTTFTITTSMGKIFLYRGSFDPDTGTFSTTIMNRDLVQIQDAAGNVISDVKVWNLNDPNKVGADGNIQVHPEKPLNYDTNYKLVVKKYFSGSNAQTPPKMMGAIPGDVVIPFKTAALEKPTVSKAELRGSTLRLEGLVKDKKLEYNFAVDGNFDNANWKAFDYTDDAASIEVSNMNLTASSKIMVGYAKDDNSAPTVTSDPISVLYASAGAPSFSGATFDGSKLTLNGLPKSASNMEYQITADGQNYSGWKDLTVIGTTATVDVSGLNLIGGQSIIQVRYKASPPWAASDIAQSSFSYALGTTVPLTQGKDAALLEGVKISPVSLNTPGEGEANTVTVRHAEGEKLPAPEGVTSRGFIEVDDEIKKSVGGVYGFNLKGAGDGSANHVKITIPYQLPTTRPKDLPDDVVIDDSKVGVFVLTPLYQEGSKELWQYWNYMPTTIDAVNHTATVDITGFNTKGKDIILGVKYSVFVPNTLLIHNYSRTSTSLNFILSASTSCGIKEMVIQRVNRADPTDKKTVTISYKDYPKLANIYEDSWATYTDNDPKPGVNYDYTIISATDMLGNKSHAYDSAGNKVDNPSPPCYATIDSMDTLVKETQDCIYANLKELQNTPYYQPHIMFAPGDSQNSVTQKISLPTNGILNYGKNDITWISDRPDILKVLNGDTEIHPPVDANGNPAKDGVTVTLTGTINYTGFIDGVTHQIETATGTVTVPVTVKWNIVNDEVIIGNEFLHNPNMGRDYSLNTDPTININTAAKFDASIAKNIVLQHSIILKDKYVHNDTDNGYTSTPQDLVIDGQGKTIKADFDGALFQVSQRGGAFTLKNVTIDMNHKTGPVLSSPGLSSKITLDNVKIINAENCQYGVMLEALGSGNFNANNCQFPSFKIAAVAAFNDAYMHVNDLGYKNIYTGSFVNINNCTFDGGGNSGYGILDAFGKVSIQNSTFKGYKGTVNTGWSSSNDSYERDTEDADGNYYYPYKGVPNGSPSAGIFVKEIGTANLSVNTISDCDNSILIWTGEKNFSFLSEKPDSSFTAYSTVDEFVVDSSTASQVIDYLLNSNNIKGTEGSDSNKVVIEDASDRYNRSIILAKASTGESTVSMPVWPSESKLAYSNVDETTVTVSWTPASDKNGISSYRIYNNNDLVGTVDGTVNSYKVEGLKPGIQQNFKVEAVNKDGKWSVGGPTTVVNTLPAAAPTWPEGSKVTVTEVGPTYVVLSWTPAQDKENILTYQVSSYYGYWTPGSVTSIRISDLKPNTSYTFKVKAEDESRVFSEPISVDFKTPDGDRNRWTQDSKLYASNITKDSLMLYWNAAEILDNGFGWPYYRVYCNDKLIAEDKAENLKNQNYNIPPYLMYKVTSLSSNTDYTFKVEYGFKIQDSAEEIIWTTNGPSLKVKTSDETSKSIELSFTDNDSKYMSSIKDVKLYEYKITPVGYIELTNEGKSLKGKFNIVSNEGTGKISIDGSAFDKAGDYIVSIEADGYPLVNMRQTIDAANIVVSNVAVSNVGLSEQHRTLSVGDTFQISAVIKPDNATNKNVTWSSSNTSIATVDQTGKVTAVAAGTATITAAAEDGKLSDACEITVNSALPPKDGAIPSNVAVTGLSINKTSASVQLGKNITLTAEVSPNNATNKKVVWSSSNPDIATVDQTGKVTGVKEGKATITATTEDGSKTAQCEVTVVIDECFIATAAYGSKFQPAVVLLRHFRDDYLLTNTLGSAFVKFYYKNSPPIANFIAHNVALKNTVKVLLTPFVGVVYGLYHPVLGGTVLLLISLLVLVRRRYKPQSKL